MEESRGQEIPQQFMYLEVFLNMIQKSVSFIDKSLFQYDKSLFQ